MDEAASSIDAYTELLIQQAMERVLKDRTSIIIARRLSTVRNADKIIVLKDGKIEESGTHDELISRDEVYKQLYDMQFQYEKDEALAISEPSSPSRGWHPRFYQEPRS